MTTFPGDLSWLALIFGVGVMVVVHWAIYLVGMERLAHYGAAIRKRDPRAALSWFGLSPGFWITYMVYYVLATVAWGIGLWVAFRVLMGTRDPSLQLEEPLVDDPALSEDNLFAFFVSFLIWFLSSAIWIMLYAWWGATNQAGRWTCAAWGFLVVCGSSVSTVVFGFLIKCPAVGILVLFLALAEPTKVILSTWSFDKRVKSATEVGQAYAEDVGMKSSGQRQVMPQQQNMHHF